MSVRAREGKCRLRKVECPVCGCICRMSRAAMRKSGLPTCGCGMAMICAELEDAAAVSDEVLYAHPDFDAMARTEITAAIREARAGQGGGDRMRCGGCSRWIARVDELCSCGFENAVRGRRNSGRYVSGVSMARDEMPF